MKNFWAWGLIFLAFSSCAYHVGDARTSEEELRVYIPVFENRTARPVDLNLLTGSLRENLAGVKGVTVVNAAADSNLIIRGRITGYDKTWGPSAFKGTGTTESAGGLRTDYLSAESVNLTLVINLEKISPESGTMWKGDFVESDLYQLSGNLAASDGALASAQIHSSREELLIGKLANRIFRRARAQLVDDF